MATKRKPAVTDYHLGQHLLAKVRGGLISKGSSLSAWCDANGVKAQNARIALLGGWTGPKAKLLVRRIVKAAGVMND